MIQKLGVRATKNVMYFTVFRIGGYRVTFGLCTRHDMNKKKCRHLTLVSVARHLAQLLVQAVRLVLVDVVQALRRFAGRATGFSHESIIGFF